MVYEILGTIVLMTILIQTHRLHLQPLLQPHRLHLKPWQPRLLMVGFLVILRYVCLCAYVCMYNCSTVNLEILAAKIFRIIDILVNTKF